MRHAFVVLSMFLAAAPAAAQTKIQCWTDDQGQRMCGDRVPPEYADKERQIMNERGIVIDTKRGAKTPEEIADEKRRDEEAAAKQKQADYDRSLLEAYRSVKDIETMRDERIVLIDGRLAVSQKSVADNEKVLADLQARAEAMTKDGKPLDPKLEKQIKETQRSLKITQRAIENSQRERESVLTRFNADIARYNELRPPPAAAAKKTSTSP